MDGLVEQLLRLESAKHQALVEINPSAYDANVRNQRRLIASNGTPVVQDSDLERLLSLSQLITLNERLLQNLMSTNLWFASNRANQTTKCAAGITMLCRNRSEERGR